MNNFDSFQGTFGFVNVYDNSITFNPSTFIKQQNSQKQNSVTKTHENSPQDKPKSSPQIFKTKNIQKQNHQINRKRIINRKKKNQQQGTQLTLMEMILRARGI